MRWKWKVKEMYTRWKETPRKRKNRWAIITESKLEAMIRIRDEGP
jgi:DNA replicative helicase MCM subunit Mcm2 (Cdc46/Mcm family)